MKAVFAITSQGNDFYTAMTRVAVASLRLSNPSMLLVVACDAESHAALKQCHEPLLDEVDEWLVVNTPPGNPGFRNRFVKTSLRSIVDGPFLFLDSDIFARGDLSEIFSLVTDIAGARNHSRKTFSEQVWDQDRATLDAMGWTIGNEVYINGGVLFYNDTEGARRFGVEWHRRWLLSFKETRNFRDQPALNSSIHFTQPRLDVLPDKFNAQFKVNASVAERPILWHYYSSAGDPSHTLFEILSRKVQHGSRVNRKKILSLAGNPHPWRRSSPFDDLTAKRIISRGRFDHWEAAWLRRDYQEIYLYLYKKLKKTLGRA
jgi:lipopolysaccharide biosynthesis glycosyltransferase